MNKHTPGPYHIKKALDDSGNYGIMTENDSLLAEVHEVIRYENGMRYVVDASHNANLFASAPDLLDACQSLVKWWDDEGNFASVDAHIWAFNKARAAIARAKGEVAEVSA